MHKVHRDVDTTRVVEVRLEVDHLFASMFPGEDQRLAPQAFKWVVDAFTGSFHDYQAIDARYHDLEHTLQGTLCLARLLRGRSRAGANPVLPRRVCDLALLAILLHDTGYLKKRNDTEGTGAKYTSIHVQRSVDFAGELLADHGFDQNDIETVQQMIRCTGMNVKLDNIPFKTTEERIAGMALGTADLLGQMAARDYVEKLPILYKEFEEAGQHGKMVFQFKSAQELIKSTPSFWTGYVLPKINGDFEGLYRYLAPECESNPYLAKIQANLDRISQA